jgi:hypothetical protein
MTQCLYCGGGEWRTNLRGQQECVGCAAPPPKPFIRPDEIEAYFLPYQSWTAAEQTLALRGQFEEFKRVIGESMLSSLPLMEDFRAMWRDE